MNEGPRTRPDLAGIAIAIALIGFAGVIYFDAARLTGGSPYGLGPDAVPRVVAVGLGVLGLANLFMAWRGDLPEREGADAKSILLILGGLAGLILLIRFGGGFIPATAILFATTAAGFGRRAFLVDLAIGFGLGIVSYLVFAKLLTLSLPIGPLERLL